MDNMKVWNTLHQPPATAIKSIQAGRMKGKSDINPQWRYRAMTETFGVVGIGWKFTIDKLWTENGANNETLAFANVSVYVKQDGAWSDAIQGNGGSTLIASEKSGMYNNDEAYKMAITDALSTALKMLGVAADIYEGKWDGSKYINQPATTQAMTYEQAAQMATAQGTKFLDLTNEQLDTVITQSKNPQAREAAQIIKNKRSEAK